MQKEVIIFVADDNYIEHAKALAVNCRVQGNYKGDFAVICPVNSTASQEFKKYGFYVLEVEATGFLQKFFIFDKFFKQWEKAFYLDCDILIQDNLSRLFDLLNNGDEWGKGDIWMDTEDGKIIEMFWRDKEKESHADIYEMLNREYPHVNTNQTFNTAFILFHPSAIKEDTTQRLIDLQARIHEANNPAKSGTDQETINILMSNEIKKIPNKMVCFWGCAEPQNDVFSETRGWRGGEIVIGVHYCRWYAPWLEKRPDMDAYFLHRLNIPCNELYKQNLSKFNEIFSQ